MDRKDTPIKRLLDRFGPGLIMGASDDDPSGIGTYSQAGAALGYVNGIANNKRVMGRRTNGVFTSIVGWLAAVVMFAAAIAMFATWSY